MTGAAALFLCQKKKAKEKGLEILATIQGYCTAGVLRYYGKQAHQCKQKSFARANISVSQLDLIEANEAFAAQSIAGRGDGWNSGKSM